MSWGLESQKNFCVTLKSLQKTEVLLVRDIVQTPTVTDVYNCQYNFTNVSFTKEVKFN